MENTARLSIAPQADITWLIASKMKTLSPSPNSTDNDEKRVDFDAGRVL